MTRREMLVRTLQCGVGAAGFTGLYTWQVEPYWVEYVRRPLPIRGLPRDLDGRTLVQISDVHVGPRVDHRYLTHTFETIAACKPDFVAITGDLVSCSQAEQLDELAYVLDALPLGRLGTVGVLGNHDWGHGWSERPVSDNVAAIAARAGVTILRNEARVIGGLQFVGMDDVWSPDFNPAGALASRNRKAATVALCHNPDGVDREEWDQQQYDGWILAGHTHGGQCRPPFLPPPLIPVRNKRYTSGEFALAGGRQLYINRGLGHLLQVRFNARPEVTLFQLARL